MRIQQAVRRVGALEVVRDLGAQRAVGERHRRVALDLHRDAVLHRDQHARRCRGSRAGRPTRTTWDVRRSCGDSTLQRLVEQLDPVAHRRRASPPADASGSRCWRWRSPAARPPRSAASLRARSSPAMLGLQDRIGARRAAAQVRVAHRRQLVAGARAAAPRPCRGSAGRAAACRATGRRRAPRAAPCGQIASSGDHLAQVLRQRRDARRLVAVARVAAPGGARSPSPSTPQPLAVITIASTRRARPAATRRRSARACRRARPPGS